MATTYLTRTTGTSTSQTKCTFSGWYKRGALTGVHQHIFSIGTSSGAQLRARFRTTDAFQVYGNITGQGEIQFITNRLFRDTSAWYHILISIDCTQSAANRVKIYVNGIEETSFDGTTQAEITSMTVLDSNTFQIGRRAETANAYFDGYMNHVAFVDGTALTPSNFGETDTASGIWKWKSPSGVTWGDNGFHLKFDNSANLGLDSSGETNNFTLSGNGRQAKETPTNVRATLNTLLKDIPTMSDGNTTATHTATSHRSLPSTIGASSGKWYWEAKAVTVNATNNGTSIGIVRTDSALFKTSAWNSGDAAGEAVYTGGGELQLEGTGTSSWGSTYDDGDIVGVAMDLDNMKLYFHKNGVYQNSGVPTSGSTGTGAVTIPALNSEFYLPMIGLYGTVWSTNFGNGYFGTTAITSAGSNGNGSLFEYDVPSGYYALNTKNIKTYG